MENLNLVFHHQNIHRQVYFWFKMIFLIQNINYDAHSLQINRIDLGLLFRSRRRQGSRSRPDMVVWKASRSLLCSGTRLNNQWTLAPSMSLSRRPVALKTTEMSSNLGDRWILAQFLMASRSIICRPTTTTKTTELAEIWCFRSKICSCWKTGYNIYR